MRIAIIGLGAMGSVYAAHFAEAGHEVWGIDLWREHLEAIRARGLRIEGPLGDRTVGGLQVTDRAEAVGPVDLVVLATKAAGVAAAARASLPLLGPETPVLTIQNGLGAYERISGELAPERVLLGVADGFGAAMKGPGHVHHAGMKLVRLGEPAGGLTPRLERVREAWASARFNVATYPDIMQLVWEKFVCNVTFSAPCTVFGKPIGELMADPHAWPVALACGREAFAAGRGHGVAFSFADIDAYVTAFGNAMPTARPSMLLDHIDGRRSEIDSINGIVAQKAAEVGLSAPCNEVLSAIVRSRELAFTR
ncbi:MAG: 2-dehydropantoate 2-reductase [Rhizobiales bacterium]|nr:2-dehydropantoate 2-reductase [Hyphomicrobiales bacterium]